MARRAWVDPGDDEVAVTVQGGSFSRILGPGRREALAPGERPFRTISLNPVTLGGTISGALTRDAVPIRSIEWRAECRIRAAEGSSSQSDRYAFDPTAVRRATWGPPDLESAVATEIACTLAESVRSLRMDQLLDPEGRLVPLGAALESAKIVLSESLGTWGIALVSLRIPSIQLDDDIRSALSALWRTRTELRAAAQEPASQAGLPRARPAAATPAEEAEVSTVERSAAPPAVQVEGGLAAGRRQTRRAPPATAPAPTTAAGQQSPVSFSTFLRSLRERSSAGDEVATSVLNQVLETMARIETQRHADIATVQEAEPHQQQLTLNDVEDHGA